MCGRLTHQYSWKEIHDMSEALVPGTPLKTRYNVPPTSPAPYVRVNEEGQREATLGIWSIVPSWSKDGKPLRYTSNARADTITEKPTYRNLIKSRRCLVPMSGFFEWKVITEKEKQPYYIFSPDKKPFFCAGIWDKWKSPANELIYSFSVITTDPNDQMVPFHDRMPVVLTKDQFTFWLDANSPQKEILDMLRPCSNELLTAYAVSKLVNNTRSDLPDVLTPLATG